MYDSESLLFSLMHGISFEEKHESSTLTWGEKLTLGLYNNIYRNRIDEEIYIYLYSWRRPKEELCARLSQLSRQPLACMSPFGRASKTLRKALKVGDVVCINTRLDMRDIAWPRSETARR